VLLVEHRDEVFARLAADLSESGFAVVRATTASEALRLYARAKHMLVVANLSLPDQSGWLLAGKLHFISGDVRIWLYESEKTATDVAMAKFLRVDELLEYGGDLLGLSDAILDLLAGRQTAKSRRYLMGTKSVTAPAAA
jgi:ActR/RegA family two-component response regulator